MRAETLIAHIEASGRTARSYSGRGMFGKECVGVTLGRYENADGLPGGATMDSMGLGRILYWPSVKWPYPMVDDDADENGY